MKKIMKHIGLIAIGLLIGEIAIYSMFHKPHPTINAKLSSIKLTGKKGQCSGVQVKAPSGVNYILSAGHCAHLNDNDYLMASTEDGRHLMRHILAEDEASDLLILEGFPGLQGIEIAKEVKIGDHVHTFTHGSGLDTYRTDGDVIMYKMAMVPMGIIESAEAEKACTAMSKYKVEMADMFGIPMEICVMEINELVSSSWIVPGSSGGMLVNHLNELVGITSATDGKFGFFVSLADIHKFISNY